jgi:hypothetical protein
MATATAAALAVSFSPAPAMRPIPFGADLNQPADVAFDCTVLPLRRSHPQV